MRQAGLVVDDRPSWQSLGIFESLPHYVPGSSFRFLKNRKISMTRWYEKKCRARTPYHRILSAKLHSRSIQNAPTYKKRGSRNLHSRILDERWASILRHLRVYQGMVILIRGQRTGEANTTLRFFEIPCWIAESRSRGGKVAKLTTSLVYNASGIFFL